MKSMASLFEELPNDMKMLAMLGGELSNSATYFSSLIILGMQVKVTAMI